MRVTLALLVVVFGAQARVFGGDWNLIDLGTLGGSDSFGWSMNNLGEVVGDSRLDQDSDTHAFFYSSGVMHDIAPINSGDIRTTNLGLNDSGQVASGVMVGNLYYPAIYDTRTGQTTILGSFGGNFYNFNGSALAINNSGAAVGYSYLSSGSTHAFVYRNGVMTDLGGAGSLAYAINNSGMIAGSSSGQAAVWINNSLLDILPGVQSTARGINDSGAVVGERLQPGHDEAFVWSNGNLQGLGALEPGRNSVARDINNSGEVVGYSDVTSLTFSTNPVTAVITITTNYVAHGFLYKNGMMVDLNSLISTNSGLVISQAFSINDSDQILCWGSFDDGFHNPSCHSFILQVPEPNVSSLLIFGSAGIFASRRWNRKRRRNYPGGVTRNGWEE